PTSSERKRIRQRQPLRVTDGPVDDRAVGPRVERLEPVMYAHVPDVELGPPLDVPAHLAAVADQAVVDDFFGSKHRLRQIGDGETGAGADDRLAAGTSLA